MINEIVLPGHGRRSKWLPRMRQWSAKRLLQALSLGLLASGSAQAATNVIDFSTDPTGSGLYSWFGNLNDVNGNPAPWRPGGGASGGASDGYLAIADAANSLHSALVFKDLE